MAVVKITDPNDLENFSEVIDRFCDDLVNNRGWTDRRNEVVIGSDISERWVERPAANTVNGEDIIVGIRKFDVGGGTAGRDRQAEMRPTRETWATAINAETITNITQASSAVITIGTHTYDNDDEVYISGVSGMTEINGLTGNVNANTATTITVGINSSAFTAYSTGGTTELGFRKILGGPSGSNTDSVSGFCAINNLDATPYVTAWFLTPDDTGATPADHQYAYCILEVSAGVYRAFGFGEGILLGSWTGGVFVLGNWMDPAATSQSGSHYMGFASTGQTLNSGFFSAVSNHFFGLKENLFGITFTSAGGANTNNNGWMLGGYQTETGNTLPGRSGFLAPSWGMVGGSALQSAPSAFSGQTYRVPVKYYVHTAASDNTGNVVPMLEIPDVFASNIRDFTPGDTIVDDTDEFLVVPTISKQGIAPSSGDAGFLILNNALIP